MNGDQGRPLLVEWAVASRAISGESISGDVCLVEAFPGGNLLAVSDGLGHGSEAAWAAKRATATLRHNPEEPVLTLIDRCHQRLRGSRGVVMSLVSIDGEMNIMSWAGVGNVEVRLLRAAGEGGFLRESLLLRAGVVGYRLPSLRASEMEITPGDVILFVTDGISGGFEEEVDLNQTPQSIANTLLEKKGKWTDDVLVLVARYLGNACAKSS